jgi:hypothetical protein
LTSNKEDADWKEKKDALMTTLKRPKTRESRRLVVSTDREMLNSYSIQNNILSKAKNINDSIKPVQLDYAKVESKSIGNFSVSSNAE